MQKSKYDDGFHSYLVNGAAIVGEPGIPLLMDLKKHTNTKRYSAF